MSGVHAPLLSNTDDSLSKLQPCANFLLESAEGVWYQGEIHKQIASNAGMFKKIRQVIRNINTEKYTTRAMACRTVLLKNVEIKANTFLKSA